MCGKELDSKRPHLSAHAYSRTRFILSLSPCLLFYCLSLCHLSAKPLTHTSLSEPTQSGIVNDLMKVGGLFAKESSLQLLALRSEKIQELTCYRNECLYIAAMQRAEIQQQCFRIDLSYMYRKNMKNKSQGKKQKISVCSA